MSGALQQQDFSSDLGMAHDKSAATPGERRRRRNRVVAAQKRDRAIRMISDGHTYEQVAQALGYANRGTVHHIVHGALARQEAASVKQMRARQDARLEALLAGVWARAMAGDVRAANAAVKIILTQCRLLGLLDEGAAKRAEKRLETVVLTRDELAAMGFPLH